MLSENLKNIRRKKGLSQEELAEKLNVVRQTVSKWEKGLSVPDSEMLLKISEILKTPVGILLDEQPKYQESAEDIKKLSAKLELLEAILAKKNENKRRVLRAVSVTVVVFTAAMFVLVFSVFFYRQSLDNEGSGPPVFHEQGPDNEGSGGAIIGGADEPTDIYVISRPLTVGEFIEKNAVPFTIFSAAAAVSVIGIIKTRKK